MFFTVFITLSHVLLLCWSDSSFVLHLSGIGDDVAVPDNTVK